MVQALQDSLISVLFFSVDKHCLPCLHCGKLLYTFNDRNPLLSGLNSFLHGFSFLQLE